MKQIIAIVKPFIAEKVLHSLGKAGFTDITVREVHGYGRQKSYLSEYQRNEYSVAFLPKIEICVWAEDADIEQITSILAERARTGRMGDGKIFTIPIFGEHDLEHSTDLNGESCNHGRVK